ncbi:MAG: nuclear transport factor 2 family protein [Pseudomonadota bacterium]
MLSAVVWMFVSISGLMAMRPAVAEPNKAGTDVVAGFVAAYNRQDVDAMLDHCADNVRWLSVVGDSISVEADGVAALRASMTEHFSAPSPTQSTLLSVSGDGPMVVAIERATFADKAFCSASVYQLEAELIVNVWYYDAYRCDADGEEDP